MGMFEVVMPERHLNSYHIKADSPEEAIEKALNGTWDEDGDSSEIGFEFDRTLEKDDIEPTGITAKPLEE